MPKAKLGLSPEKILAAALLLFLGKAATGDITAGYHDFSAVKSQLLRWEKQYSPLFELQVIGRSAGGKPLYVVSVCERGRAEENRPGVFVGANVSGFHNAGTEAALHFLQTLLSKRKNSRIRELLKTRVFYVAPVLNPDAHDGIFGTPLSRRSGNAQEVDRDRDGLLGEDGPDDLNGDGFITSMRIRKPGGKWVPCKRDNRAMQVFDPLEKADRRYTVLVEGRDEDGDGKFNEDPPEGVSVDRNFPYGFEYGDPDSGPWPGYAPEAKAVMDFLLRHRNIAASVVFGPANSFLSSPPKSGDTGRERFDKDDLRYVRHLGKSYKSRLRKAGLDPSRPAKPWQGGSLTSWLYFHYGAWAFELDVWGIPRGKENSRRHTGKPKGSEKQNETGGGNSGGKGKGVENGNPAGTLPPRHVLNWIDKHRKEAFVPWEEFQLADGTVVEVGGVSPFAEVAPPYGVLRPALKVHTETVLDIARRLAHVEIVDLEATRMGGNVWRIEAKAVNLGFLPTVTKRAVHLKTHIPVRLSLEPGKGCKLVKARAWVKKERLPGGRGSIKGTWLVHAKSGAAVRIVAASDCAGRSSRTKKLLLERKF